MTLDVRAELDNLSSEMLGKVYGALHDLQDGGMRAIVLDLLWERHATAGGSYPCGTFGVGDQNRPFEYGERMMVSAIGYCSAGAPPGHVGRHSVVRTLSYSEFAGIECSCGRRSNAPVSSKLCLSVRMYRTERSAAVWPVVRNHERNGGQPCYQVCRDAEAADDQAHCPTSSGDRCICGVALGMYHTDVCLDRFMPCQ